MPHCGGQFAVRQAARGVLGQSARTVLDRQRAVVVAADLHPSLRVVRPREPRIEGGLAQQLADSQVRYPAQSAQGNTNAHLQTPRYLPTSRYNVCLWEQSAMNDGELAAANSREDRQGHRYCGNCRYWVESSSPYGGQCRRYPPPAVVTHTAKWPITRRDEWCGEFAAWKDAP